MHKKQDSIVHLNNAALQKLRNDANACVEVKSCHHHLTLHPFHLTNISDSIKEILNSGIAKYHKEFEAILLGYHHVTMLGYNAPMSDDNVYMHSHIEADFYLFKPAIGSELHGIVNKKSQDHIGCLVHQLFNISVPKPRDVDDWLGYSVKIGQEIKFRITFMELDARLPYIRGEIITILNEDSGISTSDETAIPKKNINKIKKFCEDSCNEMETGEETDSPKKNTSKKKKGKSKVEEIEKTMKDSHNKKKKSKNKSHEEETHVGNESETPTNKKKVKNKSQDEDAIEEIMKDSHKKKKKSKNKSHKEETHVEQEFKTPTKKKKTNKLQAKEAHVDIELEPPTKKKKSKKVKQHKTIHDCNENNNEQQLITELKQMYQINLKKLKDITKAEKNEKRLKRELKKKNVVDIMDQTLPDLNLEMLFEGRDSQSSHRTSMDTSDIVKHLELPPDSDMEEVLKDVTSKIKSPKKNKRKRDFVAAEPDAELVQTPKKKKKKK